MAVACKPSLGVDLSQAPAWPSYAPGAFGEGAPLFDSDPTSATHLTALFTGAPHYYLDDIVAAFVGDTGTMRCAYGVPFHMTHGPPLFQSVG